ncbi:hypothetical protein GGS23DRAFT_489515 [Durotheca rogersii]|uniref:uncharacterized protein n=1 Tax=Durotheca rogersii TaxID=419775 RepID=UPI00221EFE46|nr:uncharacterized protein GGS23DRAFT_489515 [Durotheca rogersii]KAI5864243.1 hypothetical protein GGS23DRAFT_489515 [Durotheca rogersii]
MSDGTRPSQVQAHSRVRELSKHFEAMAVAGSSHCMSDDRPAGVKLGAHVERRGGELEADLYRHNVVFTGDGRIPLRERIRSKRQEAADRALRLEVGSSSEALGALGNGSGYPSPFSPLNSPSFLPPLAPYLASAKRKVSVQDMYLLSPMNGSGSGSDENADDDCHFDRWVNMNPNEASRKKLLLDNANARLQERITTPGCPSTLRKSFGPQDMEALSSALNCMMEEHHSEEHETETPAESR